MLLGIIDGMMKMGNPSMDTVTPKVSEYFNATTYVIIPSILLIFLLDLSCLPIWIIFGCLENCWYKKRKIPEKLLKPCIVWGIWLGIFFLCILFTLTTGPSLDQFTKGLSGSVCDAAGSMGELAKWLLSLSSIAVDLVKNMVAVLDQGKDNIVGTFTKLSDNIESVGDTLSLVLSNTKASADRITAAFESYGLDGTITLPIAELEKQSAELSGQNGVFTSSIGHANKSLDVMIDHLKAAAEVFPIFLNATLSSVASEVIKTRDETFGDKGNINMGAVPMVLESGIENGNMLDLMTQLMAGLHSLNGLLTFPLAMYMIFLLPAGLGVMAAFRFCKGNKAAARCSLCCSKCGCVTLWWGVSVALWYSVFALLISQFYFDTCSVITNPNAAIDYFRVNDPNAFASFAAPSTNNSLLHITPDNIVDSVKQCLSGSAYSGPPLVNTLGFDIAATRKMLDKELDMVDSGDTVSFGSVDDFFLRGRQEIQKSKDKADEYKLGSSFDDDATKTCSSCSEFKKVFNHFKIYGDSQLDKYGDACDEVCVAAPVKGCQLYDASKTYGAITVQNGQIKLPNGKLINAPVELQQVVQDNNQLQACGDCRQKVCDMKTLGQKINSAILDVHGNLTMMDKKIVAVEGTIKPAIKEISGHVKVMISKSVDALESSLNGLECSIIGDIYNTIFMSMCTKGAVGFSNYAWSFVSRAFFGMLLIASTVVLNVFVGLREREEKKVAPAPPETTTVTTVTAVTPVDPAAVKSENANPSPAAEITVTSVDAAAAVTTEAGATSENTKP